MKKLGVAFLLSLFLVSSFVSAQSITQEISSGAKSFYDNLFEPFGKLLLGQNTDTGELFFAKLLLFVLILSVVWLAVDKFPLMTGRHKTGFIVSAVISILSVRYLTVDWLNAIILPYSTLGISLTSFIPFVIYWFFVKELPTRTMRKVAWIFAAVVFAGLFIYRNTAVVSVGIPGTGVTISAGFNPTYIYLITAVLSIIMLFLDKTIQRSLAKARYENLNDLNQIDRRASLVEEYEKVQERYAKNRISMADANRVIASIKKKAKANGLPEDLFDLFT